MGRPMLVAELSSNPAPDWDLEKYIKEAYFAEADAVKIQLFLPEHFPVGERAAKTAAQFPGNRLKEFHSLAAAWGLRAGASVFQTKGLSEIAAAVDFLKLASREKDNGELIDASFYAANRFRKPLYRSISTTKNFAVGRIPDFNGSMHFGTVSQYPAGVARSILAVILFAKFFRGYKLKWGWSSHTKGFFDCVLAANLGACIVEKHFALYSFDLEAGHSLLPDDFKMMANILHGSR